MQTPPTTPIHAPWAQSSRLRTNRIRSAIVGLTAILAVGGAALQPAQAASTPATPFWLGAYLGNPDGSSPSLEAQFETIYQGFNVTMAATPRLIDTYVDYRQTQPNWVGNSSWQAWSNAQSANGRLMRPVIGFPLASIAAGAPSPDAQFQAFASGQYDSVIQGVVQAWVQQGFRHLIVRPGWEMNIQGPTYAGDDAQSQADWVAAFQHVSRVLHETARAAGVTMWVVWNPSVTNYTNANAIANLYPGSSYVDIIGADFYAGMYPFMDSSNPPTFHDWATGGEDTSVAQFIANPVNRAHYWTYPAATKWSNDGSNGHSLTMSALMQFATLNHKPFALPETGAGDSDAGTDVSDDPTFPKWLAQKLTAYRAGGGRVIFVNIWNNNGGGNYEFSSPSDGKPLEAAAWSASFGAVQ